MAREKLVGQNYVAPDQVAKVTGRAKYAEDFRADGMLFAKLLLSPMPHARVRRVDTSKAEAMPGVEAILRVADLPEAGPLDERALTEEPLYEGEPVLAVAAVDETTAADAIEAIDIDFEPLPFAIDPIESLRPGGPNARTDGNTIVRKQTDEGRQTVVERIEWKASDFEESGPDQLPFGETQDEWTIGDIDDGMSKADFVYDETFYHQSLTHHPMEPRSAMAYWQNGKVYLHCSTQSTMVTGLAAAGQIGISPAELVVISEYTGGGFGSKIVGSSNMAIAALLAKKTNRPVMHRVTRYEENYYGRARPALYCRAKVGFRNDGKITAIDLFVVQDNGPYGRQGDLNSTGTVASLSYQPEAMRFRGVSILTNTPPRAPQRAPGGAPITAMLEPMMDRAAKQLNMDRLAIRKMNAPTEGAKFGGDLGQNVTTAYTGEAFDQIAEMVDWQGAQARSGQRNGSKVTGVGVGLSSYTAGAFGRDGLMVIRPDGKLYVHSGAGNLGTLSFSDVSRVAADVLGHPWEDTVVVWGNTAKGLPFTCVQAGSMTTHTMTRAMHAGAMDAKRKLQEIAARDMGGSPDSYQVEGGRVFRPGSRGMSFARAAERAIALGGKYSGQELAEDLNPATKGAAAVVAGQGLVGAAKDTYGRAGNVYSFVVGFAEVEIDTETGMLEIKNYAAVTDCGTVLNPRSLGGQLHGGGIQGFGLARSQKWVYDPRWGIPFAHRFYTARPPGILDVPLEMDWGAVELPDPNSPVGAKGIGEPPLGAGAAALLCAVQDALGDKVFQQTPIMTDTILNALEGRSMPYSLLEASHT